jgi:branched-chain amino acid transport system substrate-binding protein
MTQPGSDDEEMKAYKTSLKKYAPSANPDDHSVLVAYMNANALTTILL